MLSKIDKKIVIIVGVVVVIALVAGFIAYKYLGDIRNEVSNDENALQNENTENNQEPADNLGQEAPKIQLEAGVGGVGEEGAGELLVCMDECGNGVCQPADTECDPKSLNCICV